jgi:ABC-type antimicrobial peptide transport system permease subunit
MGCAVRGDPLAYAAAVVVFLAMGLFAAWVPAARATRVDTVQSLSAE